MAAARLGQVLAHRLQLQALVLVVADDVAEVGRRRARSRRPAWPVPRCRARRVLEVVHARVGAVELLVGEAEASATAATRGRQADHDRRGAASSSARGRSAAAPAATMRDEVPHLEHERLELPEHEQPDAPAAGAQATTQQRRPERPRPSSASASEHRRAATARPSAVHRARRSGSRAPPRRSSSGRRRRRAGPAASIVAAAGLRRRLEALAGRLVGVRTARARTGRAARSTSSEQRGPGEHAAHAAARRGRPRRRIPASACAHDQEPEVLRPHQGRRGRHEPEPRRGAGAADHAHLHPAATTARTA